MQQQGNVLWKFEAIFVYKQAEKTFTPIRHLLFCLLSIIMFLIIITDNNNVLNNNN